MKFLVNFSILFSFIAIFASFIMSLRKYRLCTVSSLSASISFVLYRWLMYALVLFLQASHPHFSSRGFLSFENWDFEMLIFPLLVYASPCLAFLVGKALSKMSMPSPIDFSSSTGLPTPIRYLGLLSLRVLAHIWIVLCIFSSGSPMHNPPIAQPSTSALLRNSQLFFLNFESCPPCAMPKTSCFLSLCALRNLFVHAIVLLNDWAILSLESLCFGTSSRIMATSDFMSCSISATFSGVIFIFSPEYGFLKITPSSLTLMRKSSLS